jgi:hypothetical protein
MRQYSRHLRGLKDLRTTGGLGASQIAPHAAYMKITSLELEKLRLNRVRQHAMRRVAEIDQRTEEINAEKAALIAAMDAPRSSAASVREAALIAESRRSKGHSIRY